ncbi:cytochrome P450 2H2-like [Amblyomma americanum]
MTMELALAAAIASVPLLVLAWLFCELRHRFETEKLRKIPEGKRLPPGPPGFPLMGDLTTLLGGLCPQRAFAWSRTYGPVIRVKAGCSENIILNDLDSIKAFLSHKDILFRSRTWIFSDAVDIGFARYGGQPWVDNRRFSVKALRNVGFGKTAMKEAIAEGCERLVHRIAQAQGQPIDMAELLLASASDNVGLFVFGRRYSFGNLEHSSLHEALREEFSASRDTSALDSLPAFATTLARWLPFTRAATLLVAVKDIQHFVSRHVPEHLETFRDGEDRDFMDAYLKKCCEPEASNSTYTMSSLVGNAGSIVLAGSNTVSAVLMRLLLLLADNADTVQARIHREIDAVVGGERQPTWEDRHLTPYTVATIWETHRWHPLLPFAVPRRAYQDVVIGEYFVPRDATVIANVWGVHHDPEYWDDPEKFDPTRFLNGDGSLAWEKAERIIPFSVGKRMCPAANFAAVEVYLCVSSILQKFIVLPKEGQKVDVNIKDSIMMRPGNHKLRCIPRVSLQCR